VIFDIGQKVVYPNHGVSVVEEISDTAFDGTAQTLYHLRLLSNNSKVMVPKDNLELVGLRPLGRVEDIQELLDILADGDIDTYKDWKGRYKQNLDKMKTGLLEEVAGVLKNLSLVSQKKSLSFREKKMYERAKYFIVSEVGHVNEIEESDAQTLVEQFLELSLEKVRRALEAKEAAKKEKDESESEDDLADTDAAAAAADDVAVEALAS
jgi:CarD family transcriptional regulator